MTAIKICGLSTVEDALATAHAGADLIGVVFAKSRRQITPDQAAVIVDALRQDERGRRVQVVGLFVNETPTTVNTIAEACGCDYVQLSGDETPASVIGIGYPVVKSLRLDGSPAEKEWLALAAKAQTTTDGVVHLSPISPISPTETLTFAPCPLIIDAHVPGAYGGTGTLADWEKAAAYAQSHRLMLAGGLNPSNVAEAIAQVAPWGVDVSSGVEQGGKKDKTLIERFIRAVKQCL
jgi:phosphoribosylanthranilate isomerase